MKNTIKFSLITLFLFCSTMASRPLHAKNDDSYISVLIIDKTGSMLGKGDGRGEEIWHDVQSYLFDYVTGIKLNTQVVFYEFDRNLYGPKVFSVVNESIKNDIRQYIENITPDGQSTAIYDALNKALAYLKKHYSNDKKLIYLITDGRDNSSGISFQRIITEFSATRGEFDHLYYIDLRDRAADNVRRESNTNPHFTLTKEFTKIISFRPVFDVIPFMLDGKTEFTQQFYVDGGVLPEGFKFNSDFQIPEGIVINIDIRPTRNITVDNLKRIEEGHFELVYTAELLAGKVDKTTEIPIFLEAINVPGYIFTFIPNSFILQLQQKTARVIATQGGWKE